MTFLKWLFLLFVGLKLANVVDWSWWWVSCPIILDFVFFYIDYKGGKIKD